MLLVCGRWIGSGPAVHGDFGLRRLLGVDGIHRLLLKYWPVTCGFVCTQQTNETRVNKIVLVNLQIRNIKVLNLSLCLAVLGHFHQE